MLCCVELSYLWYCRIQSKGLGTTVWYHTHTHTHLHTPPSTSIHPSNGSLVCERTDWFRAQSGHLQNSSSVMRYIENTQTDTESEHRVPFLKVATLPRAISLCQPTIQIYHTSPVVITMTLYQSFQSADRISAMELWTLIDLNQTPPRQSFA